MENRRLQHFRNVLRLYQLGRSLRSSRRPLAQELEDWRPIVLEEGFTDIDARLEFQRGTSSFDTWDSRGEDQALDAIKREIHATVTAMPEHEARLTMLHWMHAYQSQNKGLLLHATVEELHRELGASVETLDTWMRWGVDEGFAELSRAPKPNFVSYRLTEKGLSSAGDPARFAEKLAAPEVDHWSVYPTDKGDIDGLTGLINRRCFDADIQLAVKTATASRPASLLLMDIDHFKRVNDEHGHPAGDRVLREMAAVIREVVGRRGLTYRYGGEELAALLPAFTEREARSVAERICQATEGRNWELTPARPVTLSIGVAAAPSSLVRTSDDLTAHADRALYAAKRGGRNQVVVATEAA